jgi:hypothetical protein
LSIEKYLYGVHKLEFPSYYYILKFKKMLIKNIKIEILFDDFFYGFYVNLENLIINNYNDENYLENLINNSRRKSKLKETNVFLDNEYIENENEISLKNIIVYRQDATKNLLSKGEMNESMIDLITITNLYGDCFKNFNTLSILNSEYGFEMLKKILKKLNEEIEKIKKKIYILEYKNKKIKINHDFIFVSDQKALKNLIYLEKNSNARGVPLSFNPKNKYKFIFDDKNKQ